MNNQNLGQHISVNAVRRILHSFEVLMLFLVVATLLITQISLRASAADMTNRFVRLTTINPSDITANIFQFNFNSTNVVGSLSFEYCSNSPLPNVACVAPTGLSVLASNLSFQSGQTGFSMHANTTVNRIVIGRAPVAVSPGVSTYRFNNITNPSNTGTVFVRISAYSSNDGTGSSVDAGSVAFVINNNLNVAAFVPPYLTFCVAVTVAGDCSSSNGVFVDLGNLSSNNPNASTAQFAGATNDFLGYNVYVIGSTMTAGNNVIPAINVPSTSVVGTAQFGLNVRDNASPNVGQDPSGVGAATPQNGYNVPNVYKFSSGDLIVQSNTSTDFNVFTVTYLVNVPSNQPPGVYTTTVSYIATASF